MNDTNSVKTVKFDEALGAEVALAAFAKRVGSCSDDAVVRRMAICDKSQIDTVKVLPHMNVGASMNDKLKTE